MDQEIKVRLVGTDTGFTAVINRGAAGVTQLQRSASAAGRAVQRDLGEGAARASLGITGLSHNLQRARSDIAGLLSLSQLQRITGEVTVVGNAIDAVFAGRAVASLAVYAGSLYNAGAAMLAERQASVAATAAAIAHTAATEARTAATVAAIPPTQSLTAQLTGQALAHNAAAAASARQTAAMTPLRLGMRLLGGPAGVVTLAATALAFWAVSARSAREEAEKLAEQSAKAAGGSKEITRQALAEQAYALEQIRDELFIKNAGTAPAGIDRMIDDINRQSEAIRKRDERIAQIMDQFRKAEEDAQRKAEQDERERERRQRDAEKARERALEEGQRLTESLYTDYEKLAWTTHGYAQKLAAGTISQETFNRAIAQARDEYEGTADRAKRLADLMDHIFPEQAQVREYLQSVELLSAYSGEELQQMLEQLHRRILEDAGHYEKQSKETSEEVAQIYKDTASSIRAAFRDTFRGMLDDGVRSFSDLGDRMVGIMKDAFADMATLRLATPIIAPIIGGMGAMMQVPNTAQAAVLNQLGIPSSGPSGTDAMVAALGGAAGTGLGFANMGMFGAGLHATLPGFLGGAGGGFGTLASLGPGVGFAGTAGAAIGAVLPWSAGAAILNSVTGGGLFGTSWRQSASGYDLSLAGGDISGRQFVEESKKRALFGGTKRRYSYEDIDVQLLMGINDTLDAGITQILAGSAGLGAESAQAVLDGFTSEVRLNLQGKSQSEAQAAIEEWIGKMFSDMARAVLQDTDFIGLITGATQQTIQSVLSLGGYLNADPISDAAEIARLSSRTLTEQYQEQRQAVLDLVRAYDGSEAATQRLAASTTERYQMELALLAQITGMRISVTDMFDASMERIKQSVMAPADLYSYLTGRSEDLSAQLALATDPQQIQRLSSQIDAIVSQAYGLIPSGVQGDYAQGFLDYLSETQQTTLERLAHAEQEVRNQHIDTANIVRDAMVEASAALIEAAEELKAAAAAAEADRYEYRTVTTRAGTVNQRRLKPEYRGLTNRTASSTWEIYN